MKKIMIGLLFIVFIALFSACGTQTTNDNDVIESTAPVVESTEAPTYADDEVVDAFIVLYNETSPNEITDITEGNIKTKYYGSINGRRIEMLNATDATAGYFSVSIFGGKEAQDTDEILAIFKEIALIIDPSITDEQIDSSIDEIKSENVMKENYQISENIQIDFVPTVELSSGNSSSRIDMKIFNFGK